MKDTFDRFFSVVDMAEEIIFEHDPISVETSKTEKLRK